MNDETSRPEKSEKSDEGLARFEQTLRSRSLGPVSNRRGEIMYECGYAAGAAAAIQRTQRAATRWQVVGAAAALLACVSIAYQVVSIRDLLNGQLGLDKSIAPSQPRSEETISEARSDAWLVHLARDPQADLQIRGILRASAMSLATAEPRSLDVPLDFVPVIAPSTPVRPVDFPSFL